LQILALEVERSGKQGCLPYGDGKKIRLGLNLMLSPTRERGNVPRWRGGLSRILGREGSRPDMTQADSNVFKVSNLSRTVISTTLSKSSSIAKEMPFLYLDALYTLRN